jgi:hypothetical protein
MKIDIIKIISDIYFKEIKVNTNYIRHSKYTISDYVTCILEVLKGTHSWRQYKGKINGIVLNNKHNELCKLNVYNKAYAFILSKYLMTNKTKKYQSIDSSFIYNNQCKQQLKRNTYYKEKKE